MTAGYLHIPVGAEDQHGAGGDLPDQELQHQKGRRVGPMEVFHNEEQQLVLCKVLQKGRHRIKEPEPGLIRLGGNWLFQIGQFRPQLGDYLSDRLSTQTHLRTQCDCVYSLSVGPNWLNKWPIRWRSNVFVAPTPHYLSAQ